MKPSLREKLSTLVNRYDELAQLMSQPDVIANQERFRDYTKEYAQLEGVVTCFQIYLQTEEAIEQAEAMQNDPEMRDLAEEELAQMRPRVDELEEQIQVLLLPQDPNDQLNVYLEVRAGTGGDEAAIFAGDLLRMYARYAEAKKWKMEVISENAGDHGGYKEIITRIIGKEVYSKLKFESGAHRVQRVPDTESQGRVHTSACTVAVLPEPEAIEEVDINPSELRIDTYRSSGAGGQHVNTTDSAIRITHIPTGIVVECQDERSQHKNKAKAMSLLSAKILDAERSRQQQEQAATRKSLVGSGDRSERIRTYNYPQGRVTDHRITLTLYKLPEIMEGALDSVIEPLIQEHQAELLATIGDE